MGYTGHPQSYPQHRDLLRIAILGWFGAYFGLNGAKPTPRLRDRWSHVRRAGEEAGSRVLHNHRKQSAFPLIV
jgi:hypothetical protein